MNEKDEQLKKALLENEKLNNIIESKNAEINHLKNVWDESA